MVVDKHASQDHKHNSEDGLLENFVNEVWLLFLGGNQSLLASANDQHGEDNTKETECLDCVIECKFVSVDGLWELKL